MDITSFGTKLFICKYTQTYVHSTHSHTYTHTDTHTHTHLHISLTQDTQTHIQLTENTHETARKKQQAHMLRCNRDSCESTLRILESWLRLG